MNRNRKILFLAAGLATTIMLTAQERSPEKDKSFVDLGVWVNETPLLETSQDWAAREAKDKTWVDPGVVLDNIITRLTGDNMQTPIVAGTYRGYFTYANTQNTVIF